VEEPKKSPTHEERNAAILRKTLSAISHLYGTFSLFVGWSLLALPPNQEPGIHGSRTIGGLSLGHAALYYGAGWSLWRPRRGAWLVTLVASLGSLALAGLDLAGGRMRSVATDGMYALVAFAVYLQCRP
jgi:hypothetical protein